MYYATFFENYVPRYFAGYGWVGDKAKAKHYPTMRACSAAIHAMWKGKKPKNHSAGYNILRVDGKPLTDADYKTN
jgi:hypothetical protein